MTDILPGGVGRPKFNQLEMVSTLSMPGLVALYDIRPGNGSGPFLQPRSPHGATGCWTGK